MVQVRVIFRIHLSVSSQTLATVTNLTSFFSARERPGFAHQLKAELSAKSLLCG